MKGMNRFLVLVLPFASCALAEDIINTLPGYDQSSAWGATGPTSTQLGSGKPYGDTDVAWRFFNGSAPHYVDRVELPLAEASWLTGRIADIMIWTETIIPGYEEPYRHIPGQLVESVQITTVPIGNPAICVTQFSGTNLLAANSFYWVALSVPGNEQVRWYQDEINRADARGAWRKDLGVWQAPVAGGSAGAMRVSGPVASPSAPVIVNLEFVDGQLAMRATNGSPLATYRVLCATNLFQPLGEWTPLGTNTFDAAGTFACTNDLPFNWPVAYFRLFCP